MLLQISWQFDIDSDHKGMDNMYEFWWNSKKVHLVPLGYV